MEVTFAEFCDLFELSDEQITEFADWQARYVLRTGVDINKCEFKISGWQYGWEIFTNPQERANFERFISVQRSFDSNIMV